MATAYIIGLGHTGILRDEGHGGCGDLCGHGVPPGPFGGGVTRGGAGPGGSRIAAEAWVVVWVGVDGPTMQGFKAFVKRATTGYADELLDVFRSHCDADCYAKGLLRPLTIGLESMHLEQETDHIGESPLWAQGERGSRGAACC